MGVGIRDWGMGAGEWGLRNGDWGLRNHVYKRGCEKMVIIFSQPFFIYFISWLGISWGRESFRRG